MSDITDSIDYLRDQVAALELELATVQEANSEWHELMDEYDVPYLKDLIEFDGNYDADKVDRVLRNHDLDDLEEAYDKIERHGEPQELAERIEELENAERKIEEYGDPEDMAAELQELKEQVENDTPEAPADNEDLANALDALKNVQVDLAECQNMLSVITAERNSFAQSFQEARATVTDQEALHAAKDQYIVKLKTEVARLDYELVKISDELEQTYGTVPYKALYESMERELCVLRCNMASLKAAHEVLRRNYFSEVSGFDDVPSSKPDDYNNQGE